MGADPIIQSLGPMVGVGSCLTIAIAWLLRRLDRAEKRCDELQTKLDEEKEKRRQESQDNNELLPEIAQALREINLMNSTTLPRPPRSPR